MKTTKIIIKNLFGIKEAALDGRSVELSGPKGSGKTSVLDAIRYALTNRSDREYIIHQGADAPDPPGGVPLRHLYPPPAGPGGLHPDAQAGEKPGDPLPYRLRLGHELDSGAVRGDP